MALYHLEKNQQVLPLISKKLIPKVIVAAKFDQVFLYLSIYLCIHISLHLSNNLSIHLSSYLSIYPSVYLSKPLGIWTPHGQVQPCTRACSRTCFCRTATSRFLGSPILAREFGAVNKRASECIDIGTCLYTYVCMYFCICMYMCRYNIYLEVHLGAFFFSFWFALVFIHDLVLSGRSLEKGYEPKIKLSRADADD